MSCNLTAIAQLQSVGCIDRRASYPGCEEGGLGKPHLHAPSCTSAQCVNLGWRSFHESQGFSTLPKPDKALPNVYEWVLDNMLVLCAPPPPQFFMLKQRSACTACSPRRWQGAGRGRRVGARAGGGEFKGKHKCVRALCVDERKGRRRRYRMGQGTGLEGRGKERKGEEGGGSTTSPGREAMTHLA